MRSRHLLGLLAILEACSAYVQLDFRKERVTLSQMHPKIRSRYLQRRAGTVNSALANAQNNLLYLVNVTVGTPPQDMALQLDTGSSDIWLPYAGSDTCMSENLCVDGSYNDTASSTFNDINNEFQIEYVDGTEISGDYISDQFGVGGTTINQQIMGVALQAKVNDQTQPFQGIMGVGYASGESITNVQGGQPYPNIINNLKSQGKINTLSYSLWLNDLQASDGSILFGGVDSARYSGNLVVLPIQPDTQSGDLTSFTVVLDNMNVKNGGGSVQYSKSNMATAVILDSGTTLTYLPDDIANDIASGVDAYGDSREGYFVDCSLASSPATFNFGFGSSSGPTIQVDISELVIPLPQDQAPTLQDGTTLCQWGIQPSGSSPNLFGDTFLRSAYVVYDLQNNNVAIAQTKFNVSSSDSNVKDISGSQIPGASSTATGVSVTQTYSGNPNRPSGLGSGGSATASNSAATATFDLGGGSSSGSGSGGNGGSGSSASSASHSGAASAAVHPPSSSFVTCVTFAITALFGVSGTLMILL